VVVQFGGAACAALSKLNSQRSDLIPTALCPEHQGILFGPDGADREYTLHHAPSQFVFILSSGKKPPGIGEQDHSTAVWQTTAHRKTLAKNILADRLRPLTHSVKRTDKNQEN